MSLASLSERVRRLADEARSNVYVAYAEGVPADERELAIVLMRAEAERDELARILALEAMEIINGADRAKVADRMLGHDAVRAWIRSQDD